jgi:hypothetical protein
VKKNKIEVIEGTYINKNKTLTITDKSGRKLKSNSKAYYYCDREEAKHGNLKFDENSSSTGAMTAKSFLKDDYCRKRAIGADLHISTMHLELK